MRRYLLAIVIALVPLAACGDDDDDGGGAGSTTPGTPAGTSPATGGGGTAGGSAPSEATITITDFSYPPETRLAPGGTLTVVNETGSDHTVTDSLGTFNESVPAGETIEIVIDEPGSYEYFCSIHPQMMGVINVG